MDSDPYTSDNFQGVFSREGLPGFMTLPASFICNTDEASGPGEHWVAFFFNPQGYGEYFDPFGLPPLYQEWENYLEEHSLNGQWSYTSKRVQDVKSSSCGYHAMFYILCRSRGMVSQEVMNIYTNNFDYNDAFVFHGIWGL